MNPSTIIENAFNQLPRNIVERWSLALCCDGASIWWQAWTEDGLKVQRARLEEVISLVTQLEGILPIPPYERT